MQLDDSEMQTHDPLVRSFALYVLSYHAPQVHNEYGIKKNLIKIITALATETLKMCWLACAFVVCLLQNQARDYKTFFMLNLTEHKVLTAHKN